MKNIKYILPLLVISAFVACNDIEDVDLEAETEVAVEVPELTKGSVDFSTYVSLGNSLTAGFTDNALFRAAQENSLPNILSQKFALIGGGEFSQPLMNDNIGGLLFGGNPMPDGSFGPRLYFYSDSNPACPDLTGPKDLGIDPANEQSTSLLPTTETFAATIGSKNNMGVPGAASFHLLFDGYGNPVNLATATANPYFVRMASAPNATVLGDALAQSPTFVSLWIGNNDVLGYATSGGSTGAITPKSIFDSSIATIMSGLMQANVKGVMANIPDITTVPHFTTVPYNPLDPNDECTGPALVAQIPTLNMVYGALNQIFEVLDPSRVITFSTTEANGVVIYDETLPDLSAQITGILSVSDTFSLFVQSLGLPESSVPLVATLMGNAYGQARQANENDLLVLPSSSIIGEINNFSYQALLGFNLPPNLAAQFSVEGISLPLIDKWVLLPSEQEEIRIATDDFNATIKAATDAAGLAFVDANALLTQLATTGIESGNLNLTSSLVTGGAFSLDGVHLTSRGYAMAANEFMKAIDVTYGTNFEASGNLVNIEDYPTNYSPALQ